MDLNRLDRVAIVGTSCTGKTTLARSLSRALDVPHTELDALYWGPNWTPRAPEEFRSRVQELVTSPFWVIDGNHAAVRNLVWSRATTLVWLNYPFSLVFSRAVTRTLRRIVTRERLFAGNRESFAINDPEWIPWWVMRTFWKRRRDYPVLLRQPSFAPLHVLELTHPSQAERLLRSVSA